MTNSLRFCAFMCFSCAFASAQVPAVRASSFEVGGFVGSSYGLDSYRVMGGGNLTYGITKYILPYVEYSFFPGIEREVKGTSVATGLPFAVRYDIPVSDFHGGVHIRVAIRESRLVPYGVFGLGGLTSSDRTATATFQDAAGTHTFPFPIAGSTDFAINGGGGLRYYFGQRYGIRVEAKVYKPYGDAGRGFTDPFGKVEFGFFFQLR
jgi:hypothetical protein